MPTRPGDGPDPELLRAVLAADDAWLSGLLAARPDLAQPPPSSLSALAQRAGTRGSCARALAALPLPVTTVAEAAVVLGERGAVTARALGGALGSGCTDAVAQLERLALLVAVDDGWHPVRGLVEAVGPQPLGLGPSLATLEQRRHDGWPTTPSALAQVLEAAPEPARRLLQTLTWGPPVGDLGTTVPAAASWLLSHRVLHRSSPTQVVLPREVAIAARGARLVRDVPAAPPLAEVARRDPETVAAEVVRAADEVLRHVDVVLGRWSAQPAVVLRGGGVAAREIKGIADALGADAVRAALVGELAVALELVGHAGDEEGSVWAVTRAGDAWSDRGVPERWAALTRAWWHSPRTPWLAGTRTERGVLRPALDPELQRPWVVPLRHRVLAALAQWPDGAAPTPDQVLAVLVWHTPRSTPPRSAVVALLDEAAALGVVAAGALSPPGRALLSGDDGQAALASLIPPDVDELVVQGDLTGVVPGRPSDRLLALLGSSADVDSRGAALTVRFSAASVTRALDSGTSAADLLAALSEVSRSPLPQPLEYLVHDAARRHHRLRVAPAVSVVHTDDPGALAALLADPTLRHLGLRQVAPTVLVAEVPAAHLHEALRAAGAGAVLEGTDGVRVRPSTLRSRTVRPVLTRTAPPPVPHLPAVVVALRKGEERAQQMLSGAAPISPGEEIELLRTAAAGGSRVELVVATSGGRTDRRVVRPVSVDGGRVRVVDVEREAELVVATHRIVAVRPV